MRNVECVIEHYGSCRFTIDPSAGSGSRAVEGRFTNDASLAKTLINEGYD